MSDVHIPNHEKFRTELEALIGHAHTNGVTVERPLKCTIDGDERIHWEVNITRVVYDD
jgi:hypothetical protein